MRLNALIATLLGVLLAAPVANAAIIYSASGFNFDLAPDPGDSLVSTTPGHQAIAYCPDCTASPNILTISRTDGQSFDLYSLKLASVSLVGWTVTAESPLGTVLGTANATTGNGGQAWLTAAQPIETQFVTTLFLVEHGGQTDCVCISDLAFQLDNASGPTVGVLLNGPLPAPPAVPEPTSLALTLGGLPLLAMVRRRRR